MKILCHPDNVSLLREAFGRVAMEHPYNPVKHGLVKAPKNWEYSSFHRYVREGLFDLEWGAGRDILFDERIGSE